MKETIRRIKFVCGQCEAEDFAKLFPTEQIPVTFNCWKCGAGRGIDVSQMIQQRRGMFPVGEVDDKNELLAVA